MKKLSTFLALAACAMLSVSAFGQSSCASCPDTTNSFFYGSVGSGDGFKHFDIGPNDTYNVVALSSIRDPGHNWDSTSNYWTVPISGTYQVVVRLRVADSSDPGAECEIGEGEPGSLGDSPLGLWFTVIRGNTGYSRSAGCNTIIQHFDAGSKIAMYAEPDDTGTNTLGGCNATMSINLLFEE